MIMPNDKKDNGWVALSHSLCADKGDGDTVRCCLQRGIPSYDMNRMAPLFLFRISMLEMYGSTAVAPP